MNCENFGREDLHINIFRDERAHEIQLIYNLLAYLDDPPSLDIPALDTGCIKETVMKHSEKIFQ